MARLPQPGGDANQWGVILNDFLSVEHNGDGTLKATGSLGDKESLIAPGSAGQYWRGDKTWQNIDTDASLSANSDRVIASQKALKTYIDANVTAAGVPDATAGTKGKLQLAGDLAGTASSPTAPYKQTKTLVTVDPDGSLKADFSVSNYANASVAINAAITVASQSGSGKRHVKLLGDTGTTYVVGDTPILLPSNCVFEASAGVTLQMRANVSGPNPVAIKNSDQTNGNQNIRLININGDGNGANQIAGQSTGGIFLNFSGVQGLVYENVSVKNAIRYNSFVNTVDGVVLTGTLTLTKDSPYVVGTGTSFTTQLSAGQRIRSGAGNLSFPILRVVDDTHLTFAENWMYATETGASGCKLVQGVSWLARNCFFGKTYEDDTFGGGGWDDSFFENITSSNAYGYGFGTTASFNLDCMGLHQSNCGNGWGLERVAQSRFHGGATFNNKGNGVQLVNGSHNNHFIGVHSRGNTLAGFYDANTSATNGQNTKNTYEQCKAYENGTFGFEFLGVDTPQLANCWAYNNNQSNGSTVHGMYFHSANSYLTNNPIVRGCRGFDNQTTPTQTRDIYFDSGSQNAQVDFTNFNNISGPNMPFYSANMNILPRLTGKTISIISSAARKINPYETTIYCNQATYTHEFPRLNSIVSGHRVRFIYNGSGAPNWSFIRSSSDSFGTIEDWTPYLQSANFWIEFTWDNTAKVWSIESVQGSGSGMRSRTAVSDANYTVLATDYLIAYTALTAGRTITLPSAVSFAGRRYVIKDETGVAAANNITVATTASQTIDGTSTKLLNSSYGVLRLYSNGTNWFTT